MLMVRNGWESEDATDEGSTIEEGRRREQQLARPSKDVLSANDSSFGQNFGYTGLLRCNFVARNCERVCGKVAAFVSETTLPREPDNSWGVDGEPGKERDGRDAARSREDG